MAIQAGTRLGPYEVEAPLGAGGMGEVYRARDTRLDRTVALKILPDALSRDPELRRRFEREARAISALNHPHICTLHDVGSDAGVEYLVMEHLEGETLAQRLEKGPLPLPQVLRHGVEIADALARAHKSGIVHRDLKPANVMLTRGGAKLLDFGLAKTAVAPGTASDPLAGTALATEGKPLTEEGTILGTFQYMAPEQLEGGTVDARTDVFALGALLYEMVTGRRAFGGKTRASVIASILASEPPPISSVQPLSPPALDRLIRLCIAKDPDERWQTAHDVKLELQGIVEGASAAGVAIAGSPRARRRRLVTAAGWTLAAVALAASAVLAYRLAHPPSRVLRFSIEAPDGRRFNFVDAPVKVRPDGTGFLLRLEGTPTDKGGAVLRSIDSFDLRPLNGPSGYDSFWSWDGRQIGTFNDGKLLRLDLEGGSPRVLATVGDSRGGAWGAGDVILYAPTANGGLQSITIGNRQATPATRLDPARKEIGHWRPSFLPDGKHFLFTARSADPELSAVYVGVVGSLARQRVLDLDTTAIYSDGYLLFVDGDDLYAQAFDPDRLQKRGDATPVARNVTLARQYGAAGYSAANGVLAYHPETPTGSNGIIRLTVSTRDRSPLPDLTGTNLDLSRDDSRLAVQRLDPTLHTSDIWVYDLVRGTRTRVSYDPVSEIGPVWSPDSRWLTYTSLRTDGIRVLRKLASGAGAEETILQVPPEKAMASGLVNLEVVDWSRDGRYLFLEADTGTMRRNLVTLDLSQPHPQIVPLLATPFDEQSLRISPDGHWFAYASDEGGSVQTFLQPFPPDGRKWQISNDGAESPRWRGDSRELFFGARGDRLMAVTIEPHGQELVIGAPRVVATEMTGDQVVSADGNSVYLARSAPASSIPVHVVLDWTASLRH